MLYQQLARLLHRVGRWRNNFASWRSALAIVSGYRRCVVTCCSTLALTLCTSSIVRTTGCSILPAVACSSMGRRACCVSIYRTVAVSRRMQRFQRLPLIQLPLFNQIHQFKVHLCLVGCCNLCQLLTQVAQRFFVTVEVVAAVITGKQVQVAPLRRLPRQLLWFS